MRYAKNLPAYPSGHHSLGRHFLWTIHLSDTSFDNDQTLTLLRTQGTLDERLNNIGIPGESCSPVFSSNRTPDQLSQNVRLFNKLRPTAKRC